VGSYDHGLRVVRTARGLCLFGGQERPGGAGSHPADPRRSIARSLCARLRRGHVLVGAVALKLNNLAFLYCA